MNRIQIKQIFALIIMVVLLIGSTRAWALNDKIIAVVNDDVITLKDLHDYLRAMLMQLIAEGRSKAQIENIMAAYEADGLNRLIEDKLLVSEANQKGMEIRPKIVQDRIDDIKKNYSTEQDFLNALMREGMTISDLRNKITDQMKARYVVQYEVKDKIFVNPQEVTQYYQKNIDQFKKPERVDLESIYINYGEDRDAGQKKAGDASRELRSGTDFAEVAKKYSDAPSIGIIEKGQMTPELEDRIFDLKEGVASDPIKVENGFYIFKLKQKFPAETANLNEVKNDIYNFIFQQKFEDRMRSWLEKLRKHAYVEIKE